MTHRCRLCTANDRDGLVDELAEELWLRHHGNSPRAIPYSEAGPYWHGVFRGLAEDAVNLLHPR